MSNAKRNLTNLKNKALRILEERPLETVAVAAVAMTATAKLISSVTEARNSATWKREVQRREQATRRARY